MAKRIKSGIKRVEIAERNRQRNIAVKSTIKTAVRKTLEALSGGETDSKELFLKAQSQLDKAAVKGVLHKNAVARRKSRLAKRVNAAAAK
jgi:small subunit ribosomal protein S20